MFGGADASDYTIEAMPSGPDSEIDGKEAAGATPMLKLLATRASSAPQQALLKEGFCLSGKGRSISCWIS